MSELAFIGDIHGCAGALEAILVEARERASKFVFLGDYVNRGSRSRQVLDRLLDLRDEGTDCTFLAGNHDRAFQGALAGRFDEFLMMGGAATVRSYVAPPYADVAAEFVASVPHTHQAFLGSLADEYVGFGVRAYHRAPVGSVGSLFRIGGHTPQVGSTPTITSKSAFLDTGCGTVPDGRLTCFFWPSRAWVSVAAD